MATVAVLSLALGIGVNTAIFSVFERLLLRRLPVPAAGQIVNVTSPGPKPGSRSTSDSGRVEAVFSYPLFRDLEQLEVGGLSLAGHRDISANLAFKGQTSEAEGLLVSGQLLLCAWRDSRARPAAGAGRRSRSWRASRRCVEPQLLDDSLRRRPRESLARRSWSTVSR